MKSRIGSPEEQSNPATRKKRKPRVTIDAGMKVGRLK